MFIIQFRNRDKVVFQVNDMKPTFHHLDDVFWFHADGEELSMIHRQFINVPMTTGDHCTWTGEMAQFIFKNLVTTQ